MLVAVVLLFTVLGRMKMSNKVNHRRANPTAKFLNRVNRPSTHKDRTKYSRKPKYRVFD